MKTNKIIRIIFYCCAIIFFGCALSNILHSGDSWLVYILVGLVCLFIGPIMKMLNKKDDNNDKNDKDTTE